MTSFKVGDSNFPGIKNVIFDLGGVLVNINYQHTSKAFKELGVLNIDEIFTQKKQTSLFDDYERGFITPADFRNGLRKNYGINLNDEQIDYAWNAMILDFPAKRAETLKSLTKNYRTFLLSNTNEGHLKFFFNQIAQEQNIDNFSSLFETAYYSCRMGLRKPDVQIFQKVLDLSNLNPSETLFIEDLPQNIEGAKKAGLFTYHLNPETEDISDLLRENF
jgi:epoxide hydrolase-like predicted phosphatase